MIEKIDITAQHIELTDDLKKYVNKKVGRLDRYMSRHAKRSVHAEVKLKEQSAKKNSKCTAEVILHMPNETITASDSTLNIFAAIDIVEAKLKNQLKKYKDKTTTHKSDRKGIIARITRKADKDFWGSQN